MLYKLYTIHTKSVLDVYMSDNTNDSKDNIMFPIIDEQVEYRIDSVTDYAIFVHLPKYPNAQAIIVLPEIGRGHQRLLKKYKIGATGVADVLRVDPVKGYVDLRKSKHI